MIAIVDYGMGNLKSVKAGFNRAGYEAKITRNPSEIEGASHIVLPGVGAFRDCMDNLKRFNLIDSILKAIDSGRPFLGICLGLQVLFTESEEFGIHKGLGIVKGRVLRFSFESENQDANLKIPHMGWNSIRVVNPHPVLKGIPDDSYLYFVHSYYIVPEDRDIVITTTSYGIEFASSISYRNIFACQFHPEKSQRLGLRVLKNFAEL